MDDDRVFISGGDVSDGDGYVGTKAAYMYSFSQGSWTKLPDMLEERFGHTCQVMSPDPVRLLEVVASGGWQKRNSDIFQINVNTWRQGPLFDQNKYMSNSLAFNDTFVLAGGYNSFNQHSDDIWKFEATNITWRKLAQKLALARTSASAMFVPSSYATCTPAK